MKLIAYFLNSYYLTPCLVTTFVVRNKNMRPICSIAKLLLLQNCNKIMKKSKKNKYIENVDELTQDQRDLLLYWTDLKREDVTSVCSYHQNYFGINNANFFYGRKKQCCNPFMLHGPNRKRKKHSILNCLTLINKFKQTVGNRQISLELAKYSVPQSWNRGTFYALNAEWKAQHWVNKKVI